MPQQNAQYAAQVYTQAQPEAEQPGFLQRIRNMFSGGDLEIYSKLPNNNTRKNTNTRNNTNNTSRNNNNNARKNNTNNNTKTKTNNNARKTNNNANTNARKNNNNISWY